MYSQGLKLAGPLVKGKFSLQFSRHERCSKELTVSGPLILIFCWNGLLPFPLPVITFTLLEFSEEERFLVQYFFP